MNIIYCLNYVRQFAVKELRIDERRQNYVK